MAKVRIQCDGATIPSRWRNSSWDRTEEIRQWGHKADLTLRIENLTHALLTGVGGRATDLVRIASYAYAADQLVSRGGEADVYGRQWRREFAVCLPVNEPVFWNRAGIRRRLQETLSFLTEDRWDFAFSEAPAEADQLPLKLGEKELHGTPDSVTLFSGGADSLCAAVEAVQKGRRPVLVSHRSAPNVSSRQQQLVKELRRRFPEWDFPHVSVWVHRMGSEPKETTQRTRSFLFACLGAVVAGELQLQDVALPDNGVVSLNLPINDQLTGALASRSTHPKFLALFNDLLQSVLRRPVLVSNPLWKRTRSETLDVLRRAKAMELLQETVSCSNARGRTLVQPHCGVCSQCVDRRFGSVAAGLEEHDLAERYGVDIFRHSLPEGPARSLLISYITFARQVRKASPDDLFNLFPQLADCILSGDPDPGQTAGVVTDLLQRHAKTTLGVLEEQIIGQGAMAAAGELPQDGLLTLAISRVVVPSGNFLHSPDFRSVVWKGDLMHFSPGQAAAIEVLFDAYNSGSPEVGQGHVLESTGSEAHRLRDLFKRSPAWETLIVRGEGKGTFRLAL